MSAEINTSITINASPKQCWDALMDFENYQWNPFIKKIEGKVEVGEQLTVTFEGMVFKPIVLAVQEHRELLWIGKLLVSGIFDGKHRFRFTENQDGTTTFDHSERFTGLLVPIFKKRIDTEFTDSFKAMNLALKSHVENHSG